jgi:hypothetical protein
MHFPFTPAAGLEACMRCDPIPMHAGVIQYLCMRCDPIPMRSRWVCFSHHSVNAWLTITPSEGQKRKDGATGVADTGTAWNLTWFEEFILLIGRAWKNVTREPKTTKAAIIQGTMMSLIVGGIYFKVGKEFGQDSIRDREGVLFFVTLNQSFMVRCTPPPPHLNNQPIDCTGEPIVYGTVFSVLRQHCTTL